MFFGFWGGWVQRGHFPLHPLSPLPPLPPLLVSKRLVGARAVPVIPQAMDSRVAGDARPAGALPQASHPSLSSRLREMERYPRSTRATDEPCILFYALLTIAQQVPAKGATHGPLPEAVERESLALWAERAGSRMRSVLESTRRVASPKAQGPRSKVRFPSITDAAVKRGACKSKAGAFGARTPPCICSRPPGPSGWVNPGV